MPEVTQRGAAPSPTPQTAERQPHTIETPAPAAQEAPKAGESGDFLSPKFAALARKEKQLRAQEAKFKAEQEAWTKQRTGFNESDYVPKSRLKSDALAALQDAGVSYDEITQKLLEQPTSQVDPVIRQLQAKIEAQEREMAKLTGEFQQRQTSEYEQAVSQIRNDVKAMVSSSEEFEMIKALDQSDSVVELIQETFKLENRIMSNEEAAREIEAHLLEEALKVSALGKVKAKLTPPPAQPDPAKQTQPQQQQQPLKTLTHSVAASGTRLSDAERRARAIAALEGRSQQ